MLRLLLPPKPSTYLGSHSQMEKQKKVYILEQFCLLSWHAGNDSQHFVQLLHSPLYNMTFYICEHTIQKACSRGWQKCDKGWGHTVNLRALPHMSVTHSCCQDQRHHLLGKGGHTNTGNMWICRDRHIASEVVRVVPCGSSKFICVGEWTPSGVVCMIIFVRAIFFQSSQQMQPKCLQDNIANNKTI